MKPDITPSRRRPSLEEVAEFYESDVVIRTFNEGFAGRWHTRVVPDEAGASDSVEYVCSMLGARPGDRVLDFGCGVGLPTCDVARLSGAVVRGLNISAKQVVIARQLAAELQMDRQVLFDHYGGGPFPYRTAQFDHAVFFESPCQVPDKALLAAELHRVLKSGSVCVGQDWALTTHGIPAGEYRDYIEPIESSCSVSLLSLEELEELFRGAGFTNVRLIDARQIYGGLAASFTRPSEEPVVVGPEDDMAARLRKGNVALSNAFHRGLFTIAFLRAEKAGPGPRRIATGDGPFSPRKNLECALFHKERLGVADSAPLDAFLRLVGRSEECTVESSFRVENGERHAARWNLFHHGDGKAAFLDSILSFLEDAARSAGAALHHGLLDAFLGEGLRYDRVRKIVTGVDLRARPERSRLKVWFMLRDDPEKVEQAVALHGDASLVSKLILHGEFLVGFDLRLDGTSAIKLYPDVRPSELQDPGTRERLRQLLSGQALEAMDQCLWTHLYIARHHSGLVLQCHPADPDGFVDRYLGEAVRPVHELYAGTRLLDMVVSFREREIERLPARDFSVYYMPAETPALMRGESALR
jgi:tocopherol O-methyltransferase